GDARRWVQQYQKIDDLDDPQSTRYVTLVGQEAKGTDSLQPLPMATVRESSQLFEFLNPSGSPARITEPIGSPTMIQKNFMTWIYSSVDGWIYGYLQDHEIRDGSRMLPLPPRLVEVVGPDGFVPASQRPPRRFGKLLANTGYRYDRLAHNAWPEHARVT